MKNMILSVLILLNACSYMNISAMTVGVGCLYNPHEKKKVVIIYDAHEDRCGAGKVHANQMKTLVDKLSSYDQPVSFYLEFPHWTQRMMQEGRMNDFSTPINVPIKVAVDNGHTKGSIAFKSFDAREDIDFWVRDMLLNPRGFAQAVSNHVVPQDFKEITIARYLQHLNDRRQRLQHIEDQLPDPIKKIVREKNTQAHTAIQDFIKPLSMNMPHDHLLSALLKLIALQVYTQKQGLLFFDEACAIVDSTLIQQVLGDTNKTCVVHAGYYHAQQLHNALHLVGYEDAFPHRYLTNGLQAESLFTLKLPKVIPENFLSSIQEFLEL